jgi:hypothetical protein
MRSFGSNITGLMARSTVFESISAPASWLPNSAPGDLVSARLMDLVRHNHPDEGDRPYNAVPGFAEVTGPDLCTNAKRCGCTDGTIDMLWWGPTSQDGSASSAMGYARKWIGDKRSR